MLQLRLSPYLAEQGGILASMGLQKHPIWLACPKCQAQVPRHRDLYIRLEVPGQDAVALEIVGMVHGWKGKWR